MALHMGLPPDSLPSDILAISAHRRDMRRRDIIDNALAVGNLIALSFGGGKTENAFIHLFTDTELEDMRLAREEQEQKAAEMAQIMKLKQMGVKFT